MLLQNLSYSVRSHTTNFFCLKILVAATKRTVKDTLLILFLLYWPLSFRLFFSPLQWWIHGIYGFEQSLYSSSLFSSFVLSPVRPSTNRSSRATANTISRSSLTNGLISEVSSLISSYFWHFISLNSLIQLGFLFLCLY